ncbi:hypothetical protein TVAG_048030 [Trichomonas vaginalis G3]|uniref:Uncharacterized protein n=1 Tax=Trichomonas vaginalis (strain ATCC PRA-98 / G3) TaxID=412133 RepID=A2EZI2_TRIV3|nr:hypothetical protein TVAGG3_0657580 [Trichomonas vaginalis G3]EAY01948.1 hypothetical protein TVAG_048030 [Trichomonas vaginalis G3]KAI5506276.1 hypothetical protein TVAGG3_0657580 [Trichomonas vaginalis G3]|eukprot:XP_001330463.1 hypothetical protein [Trichomonas vaginalis G3]
MNEDDSDYNVYLRYKKKKRYNRRKTDKNKQEKVIYQGDESFMNVVHPLEQYCSSEWKKSSPLQMAIMDCIIKKGGSASEKDILDYIREKWDIINKYSKRGSLIELNLRVVRLNCAVKKRGRHLFVHDPNSIDHWMLNTKLRKNSKYANNRANTNQNFEGNNEIIEKKEEIETDSSEHSEESSDLFETIILRFLTDNLLPHTFNEICEQMLQYKNNPGLFSKLPHERRVKAILISFRCNKIITCDTQSKTWILNDI